MWLGAAAAPHKATLSCAHTALGHSRATKRFPSPRSSRATRGQWLYKPLPSHPTQSPEEPSPRKAARDCAEELRTNPFSHSCHTRATHTAMGHHSAFSLLAGSRLKPLFPASATSATFPTPPGRGASGAVAGVWYDVWDGGGRWRGLASGGALERGGHTATQGRTRGSEGESEGGTEGGTEGGLSDGESDTGPTECCGSSLLGLDAPGAKRSLSMRDSGASASGSPGPEFLPLPPSPHLAGDSVVHDGQSYGQS